MIHRMLSTIALGLLLAFALPTDSRAQSPDGVVRLDVLDGGATARGTHRAALRFTLAPGWKTYWRSPGDAGIPPLFDWSGAANVRAVSVNWPAPLVFDQNGMTSVGYKDVLVLPVEITPRRAGQPVRLAGSVEIGVCEDVCIPARLRFDAPLDAQAPRHPAIAAALAQRPYSASEAGVRRTACALSPTNGGLRLEARITMPPAGGREHVVIEPGNPQIWASEAETVRRGDTLVASVRLVHVDKGAFALDRSALRITVLGRAHAVDIRGCGPA